MKALCLIPALAIALATSVASAADAGPKGTDAPAAAAPAPAAAAPAPAAAAPAPAAAAPAPAAAPPPAAGYGKDAAKAAQPFQRDPSLEEMRYQHLWVAYGAIWLIIFLFVFRTWRQGDRTAGELEDLKSRLAELESRNDG